MKKIYEKPACTALATVAETQLLAGTQGNWGDAKKHDFDKVVSEDDGWNTEPWADYRNSGDE